MRRLRDDDRVLRRGLLYSAGAHLLVLLSLLIVLPVPKAPEPVEPPSVEMEFTGGSAATTPEKSEAKPVSKVAPVADPVPHDAQPSPTPPELKPIEEPPPPPPPPTPQPPPPEVTPAKIEPLPTPPKQDTPSPEAVQTPPTPSPPSPAKTIAPPTPNPLPALPSPPVASHITQPNPTKNTAVDSHSLMATLEKFRADQKQTHAPTAQANPDQARGSLANVTGQLTQGQQAAIGNSVKRCYTEDTEARDYAQFSAHLTVTVDASGEARMVSFSPGDAARMASDPGYRALAERARAAVLSPQCAHLPMPPNLLGRTQQLKFVFRP